MTGNLKVLGLGLLAVCAMGAVAAQGASAVNHEFVSDGPAVLTGKNVGSIKFGVGAAGVVECNAEFEATQAKAEQDTITVAPRFTGCIFGGQEAIVKFNHCAFVFDSDTTAGNSDGGEHANTELECAEGQKIEVHTSLCTVTIGPQAIAHSVRYIDDTPNSVTVATTAKKITTGKLRNTAIQPASGCLVFPTGAILNVTGSSTFSCFKDTGTELTGTDRTTPKGLTEEGEATGCEVSG